MVDKKLKGIELLILLIVIIMVALATLNAYYMSTVFYDMPLEQSYIYDTIFTGVLLTIGLMYLVVIIVYKKQEYARAYILLRLFIPLVLCLYSIGYLIGLNIDRAYTYYFIVPVWVYIIINFSFMIFNIGIFKKLFKLKKYSTLVNLYTVLITIIYLLIFFTIITDSAVPLGLFDWE